MVSKEILIAIIAILVFVSHELSYMQEEEDHETQKQKAQESLQQEQIEAASALTSSSF
jgi:protein involved in sex pheromone biosynthesis